MINKGANETNEQFIARLEVRDAVVNLFNVCRRNHAFVAGFVWGVDPPIFISLRNCAERGPALAELLMRLCEHAELQEDSGKALQEDISIGREPTA